MFLATSTRYRPVQVLPAKILDIHGITYQEFDPPALLRPYVSCFWQMASAEPLEVSIAHHVLPDSCTDFIFDFGRTDPEAAVVVGITTRPLLVTLKERLDYFAVRFHPGALPFFLPRWTNEFTDRMVPLASAVPVGIAGLISRLRTEVNPLGRIDFLADYLQLQFRDNLHRHSLNPELLGHILQDPGNITVRDLAGTSYKSERQFRRIFEHWFGISPKSFCRIIRLQNTLRLMKRNPHSNLLDTALAGGYYDQAHCNHEFQVLTGLSPGQLAKCMTD